MTAATAAIADVMAISDVSSEAAGAIVLWRLSGETSFEALKAGFAAQGLGEKLLPELPSPEVALRRAVRAQESKRVLVRRLPGGAPGYAIVNEQAIEGDGSASAPLRYDIGLQVRLIQGGLTFSSPPGSGQQERENILAAEIQATFEAGKQRLEATDTAGWLCEMVRVVSAVPLRDTGGVYFVPRYTLPLWRRIVAALKGASATFVAEIPALRSSEAVDAILDSLRREADQFIGTMEAELAEAAATPDGMGGRAIKTRLNRCEETVSKLGTYERLLGVKVDEVRSRVEVLQANLAAAALIANSREDSTP